MPVARRLSDVLAAKASENFIGRSSEIAALLNCLADNGPVVTWLHGVPGMGKTCLLNEFATRARSTGATILRLDCRFAEPTADGFCSELSRQLHIPIPNPEAAADALAQLSSPTILVIDAYEHFRLIDTWFRQLFVPTLPDSVRIIFASRYPPGPSWSLALEWQGLFHTLPLAPLTTAESLHLLTSANLDLPAAQRIHRFARGHPLALRLALSATPHHSAAELESAASQAVLHQLTNLYLSDITDPLTRQAIEAASVVRLMTQSLLDAMLPASPGLYQRLSTTPFVEMTRDGLILQDTVRDAISHSLQSSDPHRFQSYRRAAWRHLRTAANSANRGQMWHYTADMIYLLRNPVVREAFFPSASQAVEIQPAVPADGPAILRIAATHESPAAFAILEKWWQHSPQSFRAVRGHAAQLTGFYLLLEPATPPTPSLETDPMARHYRRHLHQFPISKNETVIFQRRWLCATHGELPSPVQAACWLDIKRTYMELRPHLRRCYLSICDLATYGPTARQLGFQVVAGASENLDGVTHHLVVLDFGPASISGWLSRLVASELGLDHDSILDPDSRELVLDGLRTPLTSLEFELLHYLYSRPGKAVSRTELLAQIWGSKPDSSSNVVDVVIRALRQKLAQQAPLLATVRGVGYRFDPPTA